MSLRDFFRGVTLEVEDLFLLEAFQIGYLPGWAPERDFAAVLWAYPAIQRFMAHKHPPVANYLELPVYDAVTMARLGLNDRRF